jgi:hypothetical protein
MSGDPFAAEGSFLYRGRPPYERMMGREISFEDLPEDCRQLVLDVYRELWDLGKSVAHEEKGHLARPARLTLIFDGA